MRIRSSKCADQHCVEVEFFPDTVIQYDQWGNRCVYSAREWEAFIEGVKNGEFDPRNTNS